MRAFVTGATGFIGQYLVRELLAQGWEVTALVRTINRARALPEAVKWSPGEITKPNSLRRGMAGADAVFHLAALVEIGPRDLSLMGRTNVEGTRAVLELAAELGVPKIVYTSTVAVYGDTGGVLVDELHRANGSGFLSEYERTKSLAHYEVAAPLQERGAPIVIVCPGAVYGPGDTGQAGRMVRLYVRGLLPIMVGAEVALTWAHVEDVAHGHWLAYEKGKIGEAYNLAGPAHTLREFFEICQKAGGRHAPFVWLPGRLAEVAANVLRPLNRPGLLSAEAAMSVAKLSHVATAEKARRELGWVPRSLEEGVGDYLQWARTAK
jgi:nucleoside-diphosphate-sugar epimerase